MKVKIDRETLICRVQDAKRKTLEAHSQRVKEYPALEQAYRQEIVRALERELARVRAGGKLPEAANWSPRWNSRNVDGVIVFVRMKRPRKPTRPDTSKFDNRLKELRLTSSAELKVDIRDRDWLGVL